MGRDPLMILLRDFKISRFLTLNYDRELQRLLDDEAYNKKDMAGRRDVEITATQKNPSAPTYHDLVFSKDTTAELSILTSSRRTSNPWIIHLHGRAEIDGEGKILATEADYRARYAINDDTRPLIDDSVRVAFSANPLLFVGIGMSEADLMRPLREFMSRESENVGDRLAVALLPKTEDQDSVAIKKIELLQNYGVYTIHYGAASFPGDQSEVNNWLCVVKQVKDIMERIFSISLVDDETITVDEAQQRIKKNMNDLVKLKNKNKKAFTDEDLISLKDPIKIENVELE